MQTADFSRALIDTMINLSDPLAVPATRLPWDQIEAVTLAKFEREHRPGRVVSSLKCNARSLSIWAFAAWTPTTPTSRSSTGASSMSLRPQQRGWLRRRQAVERAIGHLKSDHRLERCRLQGALGDAPRAVSCAVGYNLRRLLRAFAAQGRARANA